MSAALDRLKTRLAAARNSGKPIAQSLTKLTKPTPPANSAPPAKPEFTFVSFVSAGVGDIQKFEPAPAGGSGAHNRRLSGEAAEFSGTPYPGTDKTDKTSDEWLRIIEEDLRAEGTTFAKVERGMLARLPVKRRKPTEAALRQRRFNALYMREFTPGGTRRPARA